MSIARWKSIIAIVLVFSLVGSTVGFAGAIDPYDTSPVEIEQDASGSEMLLDVALVRPISFLGLLIGCVTWLVATPLALIADGSDGFHEVSQKLVVSPAKYTFVRSVGEF